MIIAITNATCRTNCHPAPAYSRPCGSLPQPALELLRLQTATAELAALRSGYAGEHSYARQKRYFGRFDALLDGTAQGPTWLRAPAVATAVTGPIHRFFDEQAYRLVCYCVMPNHLHLVVVLADEASGMMRTLQRFKSHTALCANRCLGRTGQFWHRETYDHIIRDAAEMHRIVAYVVNNPVKAKLVNEWQHWPHTYWQP